MPTCQSCGANFARPRRILADHLAPAGEGGVTAKIGDGGNIETGPGMPDEGAFADDEAGAAFGAAAIVGGDFGAWNAVRGAGARHGRHNDAVRKGESFKNKRARKVFRWNGRQCWTCVG